MLVVGQLLVGRLVDWLVGRWEEGLRGVGGARGGYIVDSGFGV